MRLDEFIAKLSQFPPEARVTLDVHEEFITLESNARIGFVDSRESPYAEGSVVIAPAGESPVIASVLTTVAAMSSVERKELLRRLGVATGDMMLERDEARGELANAKSDVATLTGRVSDLEAELARRPPAPEEPDNPPVVGRT